MQQAEEEATSAAFISIEWVSCIQGLRKAGNKKINKTGYLCSFSASAVNVKYKADQTSLCHLV